MGCESGRVSILGVAGSRLPSARAWWPWPAEHPKGRWANPRSSSASARRPASVDCRRHWRGRCGSGWACRCAGEPGSMWAIRSSFRGLARRSCVLATDPGWVANAIMSFRDGVDHWGSVVDLVVHPSSTLGRVGIPACGSEVLVERLRSLHQARLTGSPAPRSAICSARTEAGDGCHQADRGVRQGSR